MSYILKDTTQGIISVKLTDAGRKKLSEGKLNIELFQIGDSEYCYDCYSRLPGLSDGLDVMQANFNAQNLNPIPEKNKAHVKYPVPMTPNSTGQTFGAAQAAHIYEKIYNRASQRGFYTGNTGNSCTFSAETSSAYTLNSNFFFPVSAMTGGSVVTLLSADTFTNQAFSGGTLPGYTPVIGDVLGITYHFNQNATGATDCYNMPCTASSAMLHYQIVGGNILSGRSGANWSGTTVKPLYYTLDRALPDFGAFSADSLINIKNFTGKTASRVGACVKVFPNITGGTYSATSTNPMLTWYGAAQPTAYWSPGSLSFENNCDVSVKDVKVWNMNINWTEQIAGVDSKNSSYESLDYYGSSGYCGTKEYLGYRSNDGQIDSGSITDAYDTTLQSSSWYYDSYKNKRAVTPARQKAIAVLHYTNQTISNFYGEKLATEKTLATDIGLAKNFRICMPWLMWHKKYEGEAQTGCSGATTYGQCFYVNPTGYTGVNSVFPDVPYLMESSVNENMANGEGLRYYYLYDDNSGPVNNALGGTSTGPNPVGKVWPDLKVVTIHDEELVTAMSYKANRSWTLPAPRVTKIPAGTNNVGETSNVGVFTSPGIEQTLYLTYLLESQSGLTTGLHCNYYIPVKNVPGTDSVDLEIEFGTEFPYLRPFESDMGTSGTNAYQMSGGTGWQANRIHLLYQLVDDAAEAPSPHLWKKVDVTNQIGDGNTYSTGSSIPLSGCVLSSATTRFYLTDWLQKRAQTYTLNDYITVPTATNTSNVPYLSGQQLLQFGDEYFFNGVLESDIMATIYEMKYNVNIASTQFAGKGPTGTQVLTDGSSLNPTFKDYYNKNNNTFPTNVYITEIGLFDNEDGNPDLMAIGKFQNPHKRTATDQFVLKLDF